MQCTSAKYTLHNFDKLHRSLAGYTEALDTCKSILNYSELNTMRCRSANIHNSTAHPDPLSTMPDDDVTQLLRITVVIGVLLISLLLGCYICVFRKLCCISDEQHSPTSEDAYAASRRASRLFGGGGSRNCHSADSSFRGGRTFGSRRNDSLCMGELTHLSSQQATETEVV